MKSTEFIDERGPDPYPYGKLQPYGRPRITPEVYRQRVSALEKVISSARQANDTVWLYKAEELLDALNDEYNAQQRRSKSE